MKPPSETQELKAVPYRPPEEKSVSNRRSRLSAKSPSEQEDHEELRRKSRRHHDFIHDGHVDFKFIHGVDVKESEKGSKYIKQGSEASDPHVEAERDHLSKMDGDAKSVRSFRDRKELLHDEDGKTIRSSRRSRMRDDNEKFEPTPHKGTGKERTKSEKFKQELPIQSKVR